MQNESSEGQMGKISNVTNSSDPHSIKSRVFVGCLNTVALTKEDVRAIFDRYGSINAISMHKGYAFVQYTDEISARNAIAGEDQRVYAAQRIDVNLSSEPKQNRSGLKRPPAKEWDCFYNVPTTATVLSQFPPIFSVNHPFVDSIAQAFPVAHSIKKRLVGGATFAQRRPEVAVRESSSCLRSKFGVESPDSNHEETEKTSNTAAATVASSNGDAAMNNNSSSATLSSVAEERASTTEPDILICGSCKQSFDDALLLVEHKTIGRCRLRFSCKCRPETEENNAAASDALQDNSRIREMTNGDVRQLESSLLCATCRECFASWRELCVHCQSVHDISIYLQPAHDASTTDNNTTKQMDDDDRSSERRNFDQTKNDPILD